MIRVRARVAFEICFPVLQAFGIFWFLIVVSAIAEVTDEAASCSSITPSGVSVSYAMALVFGLAPCLFTMRWAIASTASRFVRLAAAVPIVGLISVSVCLLMAVYPALEAQGAYCATHPWPDPDYELTGRRAYYAAVKVTLALSIAASAVTWLGVMERPRDGRPGPRGGPTGRMGGAGRATTPGQRVSVGPPRGAGGR